MQHHNVKMQLVFEKFYQVTQLIYERNLIEVIQNLTVFLKIFMILPGAG